MKTRMLRRPLFIASGVGIAVLGLAGPAAAENVGQPTKDSSGTWKAYGLYDDDNNQICSRAYNSVSSARSVVWVTFDAGGQTTNVVDAGGDEQRSCDSFAIDGRGPGYLNVQFTTSTGNVLFSRARINSI